MIGLIIGVIAFFIIVLFVIQNSIDEKKKQEEDQRRQNQLRIQVEQTRIAEILSSKLAAETLAKDELLKKVEDEKYELIFVVSTSIDAEGRHQAYFRRNDDTYASGISKNPLTANSDLKQLKVNTDKWKWMSVVQFEKLKQLKEQQLQAVLTQQGQHDEQRKEKKIPKFCENNTEYGEKLRDAVRSDHTQPFAMYHNIQKLSKHFQVWGELGRGIKILTTPEQLSQYVYSYGKMHRAKLNQAFETCINSAHYSPRGENVIIIDYGCGQGLGAVALIDFLYARTDFNCNFEKIILIEPSVIAIRRASLHIYSLLEAVGKKSEDSSSQILPLAKSMDEVNEQDLETDEKAVKFHILSNFLDIADYDLQSLCKKIAYTQKGENYFICVSPNLWSGNIRLNEFMSHFINRYQVNVISQRESNIAGPDGKNWSRYEKVFKSRFVNSSMPNECYKFQMSDDDLPF